MAANSFDDILATYVKDESEKVTLAGLINKYPDLRAGWLRQADYSRSKDELAKNKDLYEAAVGKVSEWEAWKENNWDETHSMTKAQWETLQEVERIKSEGSGEEMDFDKLAEWTGKYVKDNGLVTKTDLDATLAEKVKFVDDGFKGYAYVAAKVPTLIAKHMKEFGDVLDGAELLQGTEKYGTTNLDDVYEKMVAGKRSELAEKSKAEEIAKAKAEAVEEFKKTQAGGQGRMPSDQSGPELSSFQKKMMGIKVEPDEFEDMELGKGGIAAIAAAKWREANLGG